MSVRHQSYSFKPRLRLSVFIKPETRDFLVADQFRRNFYVVAQKFPDVLFFCHDSPQMPGP